MDAVGLHQEFVESEMKLMESIVKGEGLNDHYEDRYGAFLTTHLPHLALTLCLHCRC